MKKYLFLSSFFILPAGSLAYMIKDKLFLKNNNRDETRYNSIDYGMSWGSRTDEIVIFINFQIESKIETGDIALLKENSFKSKLKESIFN